MLLAIVLTALIAPAQAEQLKVTAADCRNITRHVPAKDVEYKAGVDVHGKKVAPADLGGGYPNMVPDEVTINIGIDLADRLGRKQAKATGQPATTANRPLLPYTGAATVGQITVRGNEVLWNGQPLQPQDEAALAAACRSAGAAADPPPPKPDVPKR